MHGRGYDKSHLVLGKKDVGTLELARLSEAGSSAVSKLLIVSTFIIRPGSRAHTVLFCATLNLSLFFSAEGN
jgi:hypothetical protein